MSPSIEEKFDWQEELRKIKDYMKSDDFEQNLSTHEGHGWLFGIFNPDSEKASPQSIVEILGVLTNAAEDPNPFISRYAIMRLEQLRQEQ